MTVHVCASDGQLVGEFEEQDFRENVFAGRFAADSYYWHEGMPDWKPIAEYRALAKTQRISFAPPMKRTVKIDMDASPRQPVKAQGPVARLWQRLTGRKG